MRLLKMIRDLDLPEEARPLVSCWRPLGYLQRALDVDFICLAETFSQQHVPSMLAQELPDFHGIFCYLQYCQRLKLSVATHPQACESQQDSGCQASPKEAQPICLRSVAFDA